MATVKGEEGNQELEVGKEYIAIKRLINKVWTVRFVPLADGSVFILRYSRDDEEGYDKEKDKDTRLGTFIEDDKRNINQLKLADQEYWGEMKNNPDTFPVKNVAHIFDFEQGPKIEDIKDIPELQFLKGKLGGKKFGLNEKKHFKLFEDFKKDLKH